MLDHISIGVADLQRSMEFYDAVLGALGYERLWGSADAAGYGCCGSDEPFAIKLDAAGTIVPGARFHVAFKSTTRDAVVRFYETSIRYGAIHDGEPDLYPIYGEGYFAAFVIDPNGYRLEAVCQETFEAPEFSLDHVQLAMPAGQEESARRFYADVLGFQEIQKPEELAKRGGAWFRAGSVNLHLGVDEPFVPAKKAHPALVCAAYDALLKRLIARRVSVQEDPSPFHGKRHCYITDPFGNRIEIIER